MLGIILSGLSYVASVRGAGVLKAPFSSTLSPGSGMLTTRDLSSPNVNAGLKVTVAVQAGNNQNFSEVLVDTGSAFLWVGADQAYVPGPYTDLINETFEAAYGQGYVNGTAYIDRVTIGDATVSSQFIGGATYVDGFQILEPFSGILGLGPNGTDVGLVSGYNTTPMFIQSLVAEGAIENATFGIYVAPLSQEGLPGGTGEITFGGVDYSRIDGELEWVDQYSGDTAHWWVTSQYFGWGSEYSENATIYAFIDHGSYFLGIPSEASEYLVQNGSATIDQSSLIAGCLVFPPNATLSPVYIGLGSLNFTMNPDDYTVPEALYAALEITDDGQVHTALCSAGPSQYTFGMTFLEHVYSAFDMDAGRVGFAHAASSS